VKHASESVAWKRDEPFFRDVMGDLTAIKIAFRNPTMHIMRKYDRDEAEEIYRMTRRFMVRVTEWKAKQPAKKSRGKKTSQTL
jgi:hypothetical protein